jgi:hypothetical protein
MESLLRSYRADSAHIILTRTSEISHSAKVLLWPKMQLNRLGLNVPLAIPQDD